MSESNGTSTKKKKTTRFETITGQWDKVVQTIGSNPAHRPLATSSFPVEMRGGYFILGFPEDQAFMRDIAERKVKVLEEDIEQATGLKVRVKCIVASPSSSAIPALDQLTEMAERLFEGPPKPKPVVPQPVLKLSAGSFTAYLLSVLDSRGGIPDEKVSYLDAIDAVARYATAMHNAEFYSERLTQHQCPDDGACHDEVAHWAGDDLHDEMKSAHYYARQLIQFIEHPSTRAPEPKPAPTTIFSGLDF